MPIEGPLELTVNNYLSPARSHLCNGKLIPSSPLFQAYERGAVAVVALAAGRVVPLRDLC